MIRVIIAADARRDRDEILTYLSEQAGAAVARKFAERFRDATERLFRMPAYGSPRPEIGSDLRIVVIAPYVLLYHYSLDRDQVTVLRILHGRRAITQKLLRR